MHTRTFDRERNAFLGLHFDSWENVAPGELQSARNRICINLGPGDRYLWFFNLHAAAMGEVLAGLTDTPIPNETW